MVRRESEDEFQVDRKKRSSYLEQNSHALFVTTFLQVSWSVLCFLSTRITVSEIFMILSMCLPCDNHDNLTASKPFRRTVVRFIPPRIVYDGGDENLFAIEIRQQGSNRLHGNEESCHSMEIVDLRGECRR